MSMLNCLQSARENKDYDKILDSIPYAKLIGMEVMLLGEQLLFKLPANKNNIGNITLPALHGGCIGGFIENSARIHVLATTEVAHYPKVINFSLDYIRPGRFRDTYAKCDVVRQGRRVANVSVKAWQTTPDEPIASARTHLLL